MRKRHTVVDDKNQTGFGSCRKGSCELVQLCKLAFFPFAYTKYESRIKIR